MRTAKDRPNRVSAAQRVAALLIVWRSSPSESYAVAMRQVCSGSEVLEQVGRRLRIRITTAHFTGALLAVGSGALTSANIRGQRGFGRLDLIILAIYLPLSMLLAGWAFARRTMKVTTWMVEERPPTTAEQRSSLGLPLYLAAGSMLLWTGAAIIWSVLTIATHHEGAYTVRVALSIILGGLTACGLTYLLVEWTIRPITARALAGNVPECVIAPGVRTKLLLSWAVGADVFLLMIGLSFVGRPADEPPSAAAIWFIIVAGLVAGSLVVYVATRSLVNPLLELRQAVGKVQRGNLDVQLDVNDGGELGLLQAGVNQMVLGLRERRTLQDLFGRHVGEEVARQALEQGEVALGGERREVGIIFVDGALCVFGAPVSQDDFAVRALRAARILRRELLGLAAANPELDAAIGVSAGSVVAGNIGDERRYEYTVIGIPVNEAARLTDEAKHRLGRVLASEEAVSRAGVEAQSWLVSGELQLRGIGEPVLVYEPTGGVEIQEPSR
jgi:adenylate cyclase